MSMEKSQIHLGRGINVMQQAQSSVPISPRTDKSLFWLKDQTDNIKAYEVVMGKFVKLYNSNYPSMLRFIIKVLELFKILANSPNFLLPATGTITE
jgi:hypothetical protein